MTLRDIDARDCCSREQCRETFPKASLGLTVRCDVCGRVWRYNAFLGWMIDRSPRCAKCGRAMRVPGVCTSCAPVAVAPSTPRPDYDPDGRDPERSPGRGGTPAHRRDGRWRAR